MRTRTKAFTLVELLTVIGIISLLLSIAIPALNEARMRAREVAEKAVISSMTTAIESFANDMGRYPDSRPRPRLEMEGEWNQSQTPDQGAQHLVEALVGLDFLGYQKDHFYKTNENNVQNAPEGVPVAINPRTGRWEETRRYGPYMKLENVNVKPMQEVHRDSETWTASDNDNYVFVDSLERGEPRAILYFKAVSGQHLLDKIYHYDDNGMIIDDKDSNGKFYHSPELTNENDRLDKFYKFIWDEKTGINGDINSPSARPFNSDSFLLINAGRDHQYFTADDICNFQKQ